MTEQVRGSDDATLLNKLTEQMKESLSSFSIVSGIPVTFYSNDGAAVWACEAIRKICDLSDIYQDPGSICTANLVSSIGIASTMGEPYVFLCKSGFANIAFSLILDGRLSGCFIAGPIAMGKLSDTIIENIFTLNSLEKNPGKIPKFTQFLRNMKIVTPRDVAHLANLMKCSVLSSVHKNSDYDTINEDYKEQARIGEDVLVTKKKKLSLLYPYDIEKELMQKIRSGDAKGAQETMQTLLNEVLLIEAGNLDLVKTTMLEVCAVLSRAAVEGGASLQQVFEKDFNYINSINGAESLHDLRLRSSELAEHFSLNVFDNLYLGNSSLITQTVQYVNANYMDKISLKGISESLHVNPSYLSTHFNREMGLCFTDYVNNVRVKRSKELLAETSMSLLDISIESGFEEQSYFTKVFKKVTGCTPHQYRKKAMEAQKAPEQHHTPH